MRKRRRNRKITRGSGRRRSKSRGRNVERRGGEGEVKSGEDCNVETRSTMRRWNAKERS